MLDEKPLVSIILPVYNTEDYLKESLDALVNQTLENIQIICIDDASTDNCLEILEQYAKNDNRFTILKNSESQGPSICRNMGLELATGEYITFYDSDDKIDLDAYEKLYDFSKKHNQDVVVYNAIRFNDEGRESPSILHSKSMPDKVIIKTNIFEYTDLVYDTTSWNKFIKAEFFKKHNFRLAENRVYQDILFSMQVFCATDSIGLYPDVKYHWRRRSGEIKSITQTAFNVKNINDRIFIVKNTIDVIKSQKNHENLLKAFYIKLIEIDVLKFMNEMDRGNDEFKQIMFDQVRPFVLSLPEDVFKTIEVKDKVKYDLFKDGHMDSLESVSENQRLVKLKNKEKREKNRMLKMKIKDLNSVIYEKDEEIEELKSEIKDLTEDLNYLKTNAGWVKYKLRKLK